MFGYDFMVDDQFNSWLIEINSSPAMDYSTDITERLVSNVLPDTVKVVLDYLPSKRKSNKDTGMWTKIFKGKVFKEPTKTSAVPL